LKVCNELSNAWGTSSIHYPGQICIVWLKIDLK
jgi:hypothetical protein